MNEKELQSQLDKANFDVIQLGTVLKSFEHYTATLQLVLHAFNIYKKDSTDSSTIESHEHTQSMLKNMIKHAELVFANNYVDDIMKGYKANKTNEYEILNNAINSINEKHKS